MNTYKIRLYPRTDTNKRTFIYAKIKVNNDKIVRKATGINVTGMKWNSQREEVSGSGLKAKRINKEIEEYRIKMAYHFKKLDSPDAYITSQMLSQAEDQNNGKPIMLMAMMDKWLEEKSKQLSPSTMENYMVIKNRHVKNLLKKQHKCVDIPINAIDEFFLINIAKNMDGTMQSKKSCINKLLIFIKWLEAESKQSRYIPGQRMFKFTDNLSRPDWGQIQVKAKSSERKYHTEKEQEAILNYFEKTNDKYVAMYIFQMETGIAFKDLGFINLNEHVVKDMNNNEYIENVRQKTKSKTEVTYKAPYTSKAKEIVSKFAPFDWLHKKSAYQTYYNNLKEISEKLGFKMNAHMPRHTFGTNCISRGLKMESVARMMGHTKITMTQEYAKITGVAIQDDRIKLETKQKVG